MLKNLVFSFVACICIQTIHATSYTNVLACTNDLAKLRKDAAAFFTQFKNESVIVYQDFSTIQSVNEGYGFALDSFAQVNYGADFPLDQVQCIVKSFIDIVSVEQPETAKLIERFEKEFDLLLDMATDFEYSHNLICKRSVRSGCDFDLNQLRCELSEFFSWLSKAGQQVTIFDLFDIIDACDEVGYVERRFKSKYRLVCGTDPQPEPQHICSCKSNTTNLRKDLKSFYVQAKRPYYAASPKLTDISEICENLTGKIATWINKLQ